MIERLVTNVRPHQYATYGQLRIAFYDKIYNGTPQLYVLVHNSEDKYSIQDRKAGSKRVPDPEDYGNMILVAETILWKRAYDKYIAAKSESEVDYKSENEILAKKVADLEAKASKKSSLEDNALAAASAVVKQPVKNLKNV